YDTFKKNSGGYIGGVTLVPSSNTEVKPSRADGTPRETAWESRSLPDILKPPFRFRADWGLRLFLRLFRRDQAGRCDRVAVPEAKAERSLLGDRQPRG